MPAPRIALVGCGRWGANMLRDLRALGCRVDVVARSPQTAARAGTNGADAVVRAIADLPVGDGAVGATPISTHAEIVDAVRATLAVPVAVAKPLAARADDAERLAARDDGALFVVDPWRYHPAVLELARIVRAGELGAIEALHLHREVEAPPQGDVDGVLALAPHDLAITLELLGTLPPVAEAVPDRAAGERTGLRARLAGPPDVRLWWSSDAPRWRRTIRVVGEHGVATWDGHDEHTVTVVGERRRVHGSEPPLRASLRAFVDHLAGGPPPRTCAGEAVAIVRTLEALSA